MDTLEVELSRPIGEEQIDQLDLFKSKYGQLRENWLSLEMSGANLSGWAGLDQEGKKSSTGLGVDIHRLKGLYVDFRHFILEKDLVCFYKVRNLVQSYAHESPAVNCLESIKKHWQRSDKSTKYSDVSTEELIDLTFNADVFHVRDKAVIQSLASIREKINDSLRHHLVVSAVIEKMHALEKLAWVIEPLTIDYQKIRVPKCFA